MVEVLGEGGAGFLLNFCEFLLGEVVELGEFPVFCGSVNIQLHN